MRAEGHCYIHGGKLLEEMQKYLKFPVPALEWANPDVITVTSWGVYTRKVRLQEMAVDAWMRDAVVEDSLIPHDSDPDAMIDLAFKLCMVVPSDKQREAVVTAAEHRVCVITGGPGTGKTTIINALVKLVEECELSVRLLAPTGRAQLRLGQVCSREASTIHKA